MSDFVRLWFRIDLDSDVIFTADTATTGIPTVLDFIPGSALLGVVAEACYARLGDELTWAVFHAGGVSFGNAYPLVDNTLHVPLPRSWHAAKGRDGEASWHQGGHIVPDNVRDLSVDAGSLLEPVAPVGDGYVSTSGTLLTPEKRFRRRTAINRETGRVQTGALFGTTSLKAGQSFATEIIIAPAALDARQAIVEALTRPFIRMGKSRQAEYGRVSVQLMQNEPIRPDHGDLTRTRISLLAVSDCALLDPQRISAPMVGLPTSWHLVLEASFLNWRRLTLFSRYRRAFDPDCLALRPGSVLTFRGDHPLADTEREVFGAQLDRGIGRHRHLGFGRFLANPIFIGNRNPVFTPPPQTQAAPCPPPQVAPPDDILGHWLRRRHSERLFGTLVHDESRKWVETIERYYRELWQEARVSGRPPDDMTPSRAQWGNVREQAQLAKTHQELWRRLFDPNDGVCAAGVGGSSWQVDPPALKLEGEPPSLMALLKTIVEKERLKTCLGDDAATDDQVTMFAYLLLTDLAVHVPRMIGALERTPA